METKDIFEAGELLNSKDLPKQERTVAVTTEKGTHINRVYYNYHGISVKHPASYKVVPFC